MNIDEMIALAIIFLPHLSAEIWAKEQIISKTYISFYPQIYFIYFHSFQNIFQKPISQPHDQLGIKLFSLCKANCKGYHVNVSNVHIYF